jgi:hypothetical protein
LLRGFSRFRRRRGLRDNPWYRIAIHLTLIAAFALSALSLVLRRDRTLGTCGVAVTLCAALIGGSQATTVVSGRMPLFFGVDFFVLNVLFTGFLFIPLERIFAYKDEQPIFREEWREDLFYYLVSSLMVQVLTFLPAKSILAVAPLTGVRVCVAKLPFGVQFVVIMLLTDLVQYWVHRAFHRVPWLWKFHSVHHSARKIGLDGGGANAFSGNPGVAQHDGDSDVCTRLQRGGDEHIHLHGLSLFDVCSCQPWLAISAD